ncbi:S66 family peptidase [Streptacidiphilus fuscans]|uniref:LD-carboxypeptidase n=1 Tax=Streptacidiphilus fuscans TaxID=2789292 RepID=A0A931B1Z7_9ACTN|nr:S66 peptidase family protein [Streptacidiphilus fuscans]MBF9066548.1 LD-carboxypeptidase [Streptacidiphilus fuscans]
MDDLRYPPKPVPGDRVAVVSASSGLPGLFPRPFELGLQRLRDVFGLEPVEYPSTRRMGSTPQQRADDLHAAFADPSIKAVISSIGGDDELTVLPLLDRELLRANPKPFLGYSDNTNLLVLLHNLGIVSYHGGSVMCELGRPGAMHPATVDSWRAALFGSGESGGSGGSGEYVLTEPGRFGDITGDWADEATFAAEPPSEPATPWHWHRADRVVTGRSWGGNLEILSWLLMADREILPVESYAGGVLLLETSEERPDAATVFRILRNMGERGLLRQFPALLMGRARAQDPFNPVPADARARYRADQRAAVLRALETYAPQAMAVFDVDFGHTDPQLLLPYGGEIRVDGPARRITVRY